MTSQDTWRSVTTLHNLGTAFGHFVLGSHNYMVTALAPCVKQPLLHMAHPVNFFFWERTSISRQVEHRHRFVSFGFHISVTYIPAAFKKVHLFVGHCCQGLYKLVYACVNDGTICMVFMWVSQVPHWSTWLQLNMNKIEVLYGDDTSRIVPTFASHNVITNILNLH